MRGRWSKLSMAKRILTKCASLLLAASILGCASVTTQVTVLDPAQRFAPTTSVAILDEFPQRAYQRIALIEAQGVLGGSEADLFEDARNKAQALGADAIVRLDVVTEYREPVPVYDPWYGMHLYRPYPYSGFYHPSPFAYGPYPYGGYPYGYRWIGGGTIKTLKAVAIRYRDKDGSS